MPDSVNILAIEAIEDLRGALLRLRDEARLPLRLAEREIRATSEWLTERRHYWRRQITHCADELREAEAALERCRRSADRDKPRDCHPLEERVRAAEGALWLAQEEARTVQRWTRTVAEHASMYDRRARNLSAQLTEQIPAATATLDRLIASLDAYADTQVPATTARSDNPTAQSGIVQFEESAGDGPSGTHDGVPEPSNE